MTSQQRLPKATIFDLHQSIEPVPDYHHFAGQGTKQEEEP
jgi:hypothetical protein